MVIFAFPDYASLAGQLVTAGDRGEFHIGRFENRELFVRGLTPVRHEHLCAPWKRLWSLNVQRIFCTDTIPALTEIREEERITILPIREVLREQLSRLQLTAATQ